MKILCKIGFHRYKHESNLVFEGKYTKTYNYKDVCEGCGKIKNNGGCTEFILPPIKLGTKKY